MKIIYIAGKYRDERGEFYVRMNIREAERAALFVWQFGGVAICPHKNTAGFGGAHGLVDDVWLRGDIEILRRCDAVWAIENSIASKGAKIEVDEAEKLGIPVLRSQYDVMEFLGILKGK
jgi:hypothetical protein